MMVLTGDKLPDFQKTIRNRFNVFMSNHIEFNETSLGIAVMPI